MYLMPKAWFFFFTLIVHLTDMVGKIGEPGYTQRMLLLLSVLPRAGKAFLTPALPSALPERRSSADLDPHCTELEGALAIPSIGSRGVEGFVLQAVKRTSDSGHNFEQTL